MRRLIALSLLLVAFALCAEPLKIAWLTDIHVTPESEAETLLARAVDEINAMNDIALVLITGDLSNLGTKAELTASYQHITRLKRPFLAIPGNHETNWSDSGCTEFARLYGDDKFFHREGDYIFVGVASGPWLQMGDGYIKKRDLAWLESKLREEVTEDDKVVFVCHYPLNMDLSNAEDALAILKKFPTIVALGGHYHSLNHFDYNGIPGILGRAISMRHNNMPTPGYNLLEIDGDAVKLFNKPIDEPMEAEPRIVAGISPMQEVTFRPAENAPMPRELELFREVEGSLFAPIAITANGIIFDDNEKEFSGILPGHNVLVRGSVAGRIEATSINSKGTNWRIETEAPITNTGLIVENVLHMGLGTDHFVAINTSTGEEIWRFSGVNGRFQAPPAVRDNIVAFGAWDTHLYVLDRNTGELKWKWNNGSTAVGYSPGNVTPMIGSKNIAIVAPDRYLTIFNRENGTVLLRSNEYKFRESLVGDGGFYAYAKTMDGELVVVDVDKATIEKVIDAGLGYEHTPCPPAVMFGDIFVTGRQGDLVRIDPKSGEVKWRYRCGKSAFIQLAQDSEENYLYAVMLDGKIYRVSGLIADCDSP